MNTDILEVIKKVQYLEQEYLKYKYIASDQNSLKSIETFGKWHSAASVLFSLAYLEEDRNFIKFQEENTGGNAFVLSSIYDKIHSSYEILMAKVNNIVGSSIFADKIMNVPQIFISHSSKDKEIVKAFIDYILKNGLNLADTDIACTSFDATGVSPGDNIPLYIKRNISGAKICLSMVSINYKKAKFV